MSTRSLVVMTSFVAVVGLLVNESRGGDVARRDAKADRLVRAALESEIRGDAVGRRRLLEEALHVSEDCAAAHWQLGHLQIDGEWLTIKQAQRRAQDDTRMTEYWKLANVASLKPKDQLRLARWCDEQGLGDLAQLHWYRVLRHQPKNKEAAAHLGLKEHRGRFLTERQIAAQKSYEAAEKRWEPQIIRWRRAITRGTPEKRRSALTELRAVTDVEAIPFLIDGLADDAELGKEVVSLLAQMDPYQTYGWLAMLSVGHDDEEFRDAAIERLTSIVQQNPGVRHGALPILLSAFQAPVEFSYYVSTLNVIGYSLSREGPFYDQEWTHTDAFRVESRVEESRDAPYNARISWSYPSKSTLAVLRAGANRKDQIMERRLAGRALQNAAGIRDAVQQQNTRAEVHNQRVFKALRAVSGQHHPDSLQAWWDWWQQQNEWQSVGQKPVFRGSSQHRAKRLQTIQFGPVVNLSCFVRGTPVWAETGPKPIEEVGVGERVLSRDSETGELKYRLVVQTTLRPPSDTLRVKVGDEELWTTLGHLFWVSGKGWTMAKQLQVGDVLHGAEGPTRVAAVEPGPKAEAHNLVVANYNTYFVGPQKVLVHDNRPHRIGPVLVPGMNELVVAD